MIIVKLYGGMGNQMFQYALGKHMAIKNNTFLKLDTSEFEKKLGRNVTPRQYSLFYFNFLSQFATKQEVSLFIGSRSKLRTLIGVINKKRTNKKYIKESNFKFKPSILKQGPEVYLDGYWQSEKYFSAVKETIKNDLAFTDETIIQMKSNVELSKAIKNIEKNNSVSIHIRRGDYVYNSVVKRRHGVCNLSYYYKAINLINSRINDPFYFIFTDDPEWVRNNLKINKPFLIFDKNKDFEDFYLMKLCKYNIIANSSFSWWAAWLNENSKKMILAPRKWCNDSIDISDLIPVEWELI
jgi:hypothetical protein